MLNVSRDTVTGNRTVCLNWTHESFSLSLDFITDGSLDRYSVLTTSKTWTKASKKRRVAFRDRWTRGMNVRIYVSAGGESFFSFPWIGEGKQKSSARMDTCSRMKGTRRGSFRGSLETSEEQLKLWVDNFSPHIGNYFILLSKNGFCDFWNDMWLNFRNFYFLCASFELFKTIYLG